MSFVIYKVLSNLAKETFSVFTYYSLEEDNCDNNIANNTNYFKRYVSLRSTLACHKLQVN